MTTTKTIINIMIPLLLFFTLNGCLKNDPDIQRTLTASSSEFNIDDEATTFTVELESNTDWSIGNPETWVTATPLSGNGNATVTFTTEKNTSTVIRTAVLTVSGTGVDALSISITQQAGAILVTPYEALGGPLPTKDEAILFAPELVTKTTTFERVVAIAPDLKELFFSVESNIGPRIWNSQFINNTWTTPALVSFSQQDISLEPFISPDGNKLFFVSAKPPSTNADIYVVNKLNGAWSTPTSLGSAVNTDTHEFHPAVSSSGDLYFASDKAGGKGKADLYFSKFENGAYAQNQNLGDVINTADHEWDPYISPDGSYIIFKSDRPGGYGGMDMYVTVNKNGDWTAPKNLGPVINTNINDDAGDVTPDGKYLIFARMTPSSMDIYWIHMDAIKDLLK